MFGRLELRLRQKLLHTVVVVAHLSFVSFSKLINSLARTCRQTADAGAVNASFLGLLAHFLVVFTVVVLAATAVLTGSTFGVTTALAGVTSDTFWALTLSAFLCFTY